MTQWGRSTAYPSAAAAIRLIEFRTLDCQLTMTLYLRQLLLNAVALALGVALFSMPAVAVTVPDLYDVSLPVAGGRDTAFVDALKAVAVRVSGRRDAGSHLGAAASNPRQYVQRFGFTSDNQLQVGFDGVAIDRLLGDVGLPVWGRERPVTLVLLNVEAPDGSARWIDAHTATAEREQLAKTAVQRGLPLIWPVNAPDVSASTAPADRMRIAVTYNANGVLLGRARRGADGAYAVNWSLTTADSASDVSGSLEDGVHLAADSFARAYAVSGSQLDSVLVEVSGIASLNAYATTLNYLEGMTLVRSVAVENVTADTMRFRLAVRGDATTFRRALALDNRLVPLTASGEGAVTDRLQLRYQP